MIKFSFTKQKHTNKINVWHNNIFVGTLEMFTKENPNIDWPALRANKTLHLEHSERWLYTWKAMSSSNISTIGVFNSREEASEAILNEHCKKFENETRRLG